MSGVVTGYYSDRRCSGKRYSDSLLTLTRKRTLPQSALVWVTVDWRKFPVKRNYCTYYRPSCRNSALRSRNHLPSGVICWWLQMNGSWSCWDSWTFQQFLTELTTSCCWNACDLLLVCLSPWLAVIIFDEQNAADCLRWLLVSYWLCSLCCLGFRRDPYWVRCCTFCKQLSSPSL